MVFRDTPAEENVNLVKISFGILLKNASYTDTEMCAIATAKLHTVIQTRKMSDLNEGCYILYLLNEIISDDLKGIICLVWVNIIAQFPKKLVLTLYLFVLQKETWNITHSWYP